MQFAGKYIKIVIKKLVNCWGKAAKLLEKAAKLLEKAAKLLEKAAKLLGNACKLLESLFAYCWEMLAKYG